MQNNVSITYLLVEITMYVSDFRHRLAVMPTLPMMISDPQTAEDPEIKAFAMETGRGILERLEDPE